MRQCTRGFFFTAILTVCIVFLVQETPAAEPAAIPNRIARAKPGEWVEYKLGRTMSRKFTVLEMSADTDGPKVKLRSETLMNGRVMNAEESEHPVAEANVLLKEYANADLVVDTAVITVNAREFEVVRLTGRDKGVSFTIYTTDAVPVFGLARFDIAGEKFFEAAAFGFGDE